MSTLILSILGASALGALIVAAPRAMQKLLTVSPEERR